MVQTTHMTSTIDLHDCRGKAVKDGTVVLFHVTEFTGIDKVLGGGEQ